MQTASQTFGFNLAFLLHEHNVDLAQFCTDLGYSFKDAKILLDGRGYIPISEQMQIAEYFNTTLEVMLTERKSADYEAAGCYTCMGEFNETENRNKIFSIFNLYADVLDALDKE